MTNISDVTHYIRQCTDSAELKQIRSAFHDALKGVQSHAAATFNIGNRVTFSGKGITRWGTITAINRKTISVRETDSNFGVRNGIQNNWRISPSLLKLSKNVGVGLPSNSQVPRGVK